MLACAFAVGHRSVRSIISSRRCPNTSGWQQTSLCFAPMREIPDGLKLWRRLPPLVSVVHVRLASFIHVHPRPTQRCSQLRGACVAAEASCDRVPPSDCKTSATSSKPVVGLTDTRRRSQAWDSIAQVIVPHHGRHTSKFMEVPGHFQRVCWVVNFD